MGEEGGGPGGGEEGGEGEPVLPTFDRLHPSRFVVLSFPNPLYPSDPDAAESLRVAVLDSPAPAPAPTTAAMIVPRGREADWVFCTAAGHLQLLLASSASRLVLVGNPPVGDSPLPVYTRRWPSSAGRHEQMLLPLLIALCPRSAFEGGRLPQVPFVSYEDGLVWGTVLEVAAGPVAGAMLVEDVEVEVVETAEPDTAPLIHPPAATRERRRRLRFKRVPNLVQSQMRLVPDTTATDSSSFRAETGVLVQPYLAPMVAGLQLASPWIEKKTQVGLRPRVLCLGVGGGALLTFLESHLGFDVLGMEADEVVLGVARQHFGLMESEFLKVMVEDGIKFFQSLCRENRGGKCRSRGACCTHGRLEWWQEYLQSELDVVMVDLDSEDASNGVMAPPVEFVNKDVLSGIKSVLHEQGMLVMNVIPLSGCFHDELVGHLHEVFSELYETDVGNGENCVLLAMVSPVGSFENMSEGSFVRKLRQIVGDNYMDALRKV